MLPLEALLLMGATFSLACEGTRTTYFGDLEPRTESVAVEYRVNLAARRFCIGTCEQSAPIHDVAADVITLARSEQRDEAEASSGLLTIRRSTGGWLERIEVTRPHALKMVTTGKCEVRPYKPVLASPIG